MSKTTLYIASSIDGYIATKDGGVDWLSFAESGSEDYGYNEFYEKIDALVMGKKLMIFVINLSNGHMRVNIVLYLRHKI